MNITAQKIRARSAIACFAIAIWSVSLAVPALVFGQEHAEEVQAEIDHQVADEVHGEHDEAAHGHDDDGAAHVDGAHDDSHAHDDHGAAHGEHAAHGGQGESHGAGGHHDPYDLSAANAGPNLNKPEEFRSDLALWTLVVFGLLMGILWKFAWGPISAALDSREKKISDQIDEAHRCNEEARRLLAEHEEKVAKASDEVRDMMDQARRDAETQKTRIIADAEAAAKAEKDRAVREIGAAKNNALEELAKSSVDQAIGLAGNIIGQKLDKNDHARLIQEALKQFPSEN